MNRRAIIVTATLPLLLASGEPEPIPLVGMWRLKSADMWLVGSGVRESRYGANPSGRLTFDSQGGYSLVIMSADQSKEGRAHSGNYSVDNAHATMTLRIVRATPPDSQGTAQDWSFWVAADRLIMTSSTAYQRPMVWQPFLAPVTELEWTRVGTSRPKRTAERPQGCYELSIDHRAVAHVVPGGFPDSVTLSPSFSAADEYLEGAVFARALPDSLVTVRRSHEGISKGSLRYVARWMVDGSGDTLVFERWIDLYRSLRTQFRREGANFVGEWGQYVDNVRGSGGPAALERIDCPS